MKFLGIDLTYTANYWLKLLGLKKPPQAKESVVPLIKKETPIIIQPTIDPTENDLFITFNPSEIVSDKEFTDCDSMTEAQIQDFLVSKGGVILPNYTNNGYLFSYWLNKHCKDLGLNPKILLTHLQKEMGAVTRKTPFKKQHSYDYILGVGAYDGKWSEEWKGMDKQLLKAAQISLKWYNRGNEKNTYPINLKAGDRKDLMINNSASYSLYKYTPWVGDEDKKIATNKGFSTYKAPFGVFLFWKVYKGFFKRK